MADKKDIVYQKYIILDGETKKPSKGTFFVLKLDSKDEGERRAVERALDAYAFEQARQERLTYAFNIERFIRSVRQEENKDASQG